MNGLLNTSSWSPASRPQERVAHRPLDVADHRQRGAAGWPSIRCGSPAMNASGAICVGAPARLA